MQLERADDHVTVLSSAEGEGKEGEGKEGEGKGGMRARNGERHIPQQLRELLAFARAWKGGADVASPAVAAATVDHISPSPISLLLAPSPLDVIPGLTPIASADERQLADAGAPGGGGTGGGGGGGIPRSGSGAGGSSEIVKDKDSAKNTSPNAVVPVSEEDMEAGGGRGEKGGEGVREQEEMERGTDDKGKSHPWQWQWASEWMLREGEGKGEGMGENPSWGEKMVAWSYLLKQGVMRRGDKGSDRSDSDNGGEERRGVFGQWIWRRGGQSDLTAADDQDEEDDIIGGGGGEDGRRAVGREGRGAWQLGSLRQIDPLMPKGPTYRNGWWRELSILCWRQYIIVKRTPLLWVMRLILILCTGVLGACLFWQVPYRCVLCSHA